MESIKRDVRLDCIRAVFGTDGAVALAEYYAHLVDPGAFSWFDAVLHISNRLGLSGEDLTRLHADSGPLEDAIVQAAATLPATPPTRF
jgi:hypothetical protein